MSNDTLAWRFESMAPRLPVADIESALDFYVDILGFELAWKWGDPLTHVGLCRDALTLDLLAVSPERQGTAMAYVHMSGVDAYHMELTARGAPVSSIGDRPYRMRDFEVVDLSGNSLIFGEPVE